MLSPTRKALLVSTGHEGLTTPAGGEPPDGFLSPISPLPSLRPTFALLRAPRSPVAATRRPVTHHQYSYDCLKGTRLQPSDRALLPSFSATPGMSVYGLQKHLSRDPSEDNPAISEHPSAEDHVPPVLMSPPRQADVPQQLFSLSRASPKTISPQPRRIALQILRFPTPGK